MASSSSSSFLFRHPPPHDDDAFHISRGEDTVDINITRVVAACLSRTWNCDNDVFINFRGLDTRANITSILHGALCAQFVKAFIDDALERGVTVLPALFRKIERSLISMTVFSKDYAASADCVLELDKILECQEMNGQIVIPIFYGEGSSDVQGVIGILGNAFIKHLKEQYPNADPEAIAAKAEKWQARLTEASNLFGWVSVSIGSDRKLLEDIVKDITNKLVLLSVSMADKLATCFDIVCDKLDSNAGAFWNNLDMKQLHIRLRYMHHLLQEARLYTLRQHRLLRVWFKDLRNLAYDIDELMVDYEKSEITNSQFDQAVRRIDKQLVMFSNLFWNLVTSHHNGERSDISETILLMSPSLLPFIDSTSFSSARTATTNKHLYDLSGGCSAKKAVLALEINDVAAQQQAFNVVSQLRGISDISFNPANKKMTVVGDIDAVDLVSKLREVCSTELVSLGEENESEDGRCNEEEPRKKKEKKEKKDGAESGKGISRKSSILSCLCFSPNGNGG